MREFFKGWSRKAAWALLTLAYAATGMWMRGQQVNEVFSFSLFGIRHVIATYPNAATWRAWNEADTTEVVAMINWGSPQIHDDVLAGDWTPLHPDISRAINIEIGSPDHISCFEIQYWKAIWTSILLSACLMLWKARPKGVT